MQGWSVIHYQCSKKQIYILVWAQLPALPDFPGDLTAGSLPELSCDVKCFAVWDLNVRKLASNIWIFKLKPKEQADLE